MSTAVDHKSYISCILEPQSEVHCTILLQTKLFLVYVQDESKHK